MERKPRFIMMVGLPGCGKSTTSQELKTSKTNGGDWVHLSSDEIREELGDVSHSEVFSEMQRRAVAAISAGRDVIYDATNLSRKHRMAALAALNKKGVPETYKACYMFPAPVSVCKARNAQRTGKARVPDEVIDRMLCSFKVPVEQEGFDHIYFVSDEDYEDAPIGFSLEDAVGYDQDNHHHALTLDKHLDGCEERVRSECRRRGLSERQTSIAETAARYHDIGKLATKTYVNTHGMPTDEAHYYGHDSAGAYLFLTEVIRDREHNGFLNGMDWNDIISTALLIENHMKPYQIQPNSKADRKMRQLLGEDIYPLLGIIHKADEAAHGFDAPDMTTTDPQPTQSVLSSHSAGGNDSGMVWVDAHVRGNAKVQGYWRKPPRRRGKQRS